MPRPRTEKPRLYHPFRFLVVVLNVFAAAFLYLLAKWAKLRFGTITIQMIIFHVLMPMEGAETSAVSDAVNEVLVPAVQFTLWFAAVLAILVQYWVHRPRKCPLDVAYCELGARRMLSTGMIISLALLLTTCQSIDRQYQIVEYIKDLNTDSTFIEQNYVDPANTAIAFPENKRNLIHIVLESMESSFMDPSSGGLLDQNTIPELGRLAEGNISFSDSDRLGGFKSVTDTQWTIAALFAQSAGLPLTLPIDGNSMSDYVRFFPGVTALGDILAKAGYQNTFLLGSDVAFGGRDKFYIQHGNYDIIDYHRSMQQGFIPQGYHVWWGFEDKKLFAIARDTLKDLAAGDKPFNLTLLTVDTHFEDGYVCDLCQDDFDRQYANVLACSSRQVAELVDWIRQQDFYENTTIVITGDHLTMDADFFPSTITEGERSVYNAFINARPAGAAAPTGTAAAAGAPPAGSALDPARMKNRQFSAFDIFPTTLSALGARIDGDALGLGVDLFSGKKTLVETHGLANVNNWLSQHSYFYTNRLFYGVR